MCNFLKWQIAQDRHIENLYKTFKVKLIIERAAK